MTLAVDTPSPSEPPAAPRDPAAYGRRRARGGVAFGAIVLFGLACALGGAVFAWFGPRLLTPSVPTAAAPSPAPADSPIPFGPSVPLAPAPTPVETPPASVDVGVLQDRIVALEAAQNRTAQAAAATLAASALVEASRSSRPFAAELTAVERLLPPSADLRALRRQAETGAPSRAALADDFEAAAARAAVAARAPADGAGFLDQVAYAFSSVVSVRRVSRTSGDTPDAVLARAEQLVADGDLEAALTTLDALPPRSREAMAVWRGRAERRAEIDRAVAGIRAQALANLSQARP